MHVIDLRKLATPVDNFSPHGIFCEMIKLSPEKLLLESFHSKETPARGSKRVEHAAPRGSWPAQTPICRSLFSQKEVE